jgi:hypothetical protein
MLKGQARNWLLSHPADRWRLRTSVRTNPLSGLYEDDMDRFFVGRSPWQVGAGDIWRWRAACQALRELEQEK